MHRPHPVARLRRLAAARFIAALACIAALSACGGATVTPTPAGPSSPTPPRTSGASSPTASLPSVPAGSSGDQPVPFQTGNATLKLTGGETADLALKEIAPEDTFSGWDPVEGTTVVWRESQKGWYLSVTGFFGTGDLKTDDPTPFLNITSPDGEQVQDSSGRCTVHVKTSSAERFEGSIECAGLAWEDENGDPAGPTFDATATFTAAP